MKWSRLQRYNIKGREVTNGKTFQFAITTKKLEALYVFCILLFFYHVSAELYKSYHLHLLLQHLAEILIQKKLIEVCVVSNNNIFSCIDQDIKIHSQKIQNRSYMTCSAFKFCHMWKFFFSTQNVKNNSYLTQSRESSLKSESIKRYVEV